MIYCMYCGEGLSVEGLSRGEFCLCQGDVAAASASAVASANIREADLISDVAKIRLKLETANRRVRDLEAAAQKHAEQASARFKEGWCLAMQVMGKFLNEHREGEAPE
jgi:hypothetical protein